MRKKVGQTIDIDERWEKNIPHDKRSEELYHFISEYDFKFVGDSFPFNSGGDGDNGETLMYILDEYFADKDKKEKPLGEPN